MILTPIDAGELPAILTQYGASLDAASQPAFSRIADPSPAHRAEGAAATAHHAAACALAESIGMGLLPGSPALDFSWNGSALRSGTEAYVVLHEVAHFQLASPERRRVVDFGLGAGPETSQRDLADHAALVFGLAREAEEAAASLLGVLWEVEMGQPGLASFLDQNWLEGAGRPGAAAHFRAVLERLQRASLVDREGRPQARLATV
jgi:hypothetical protein